MVPCAHLAACSVTSDFAEQPSQLEWDDSFQSVLREQRAAHTRDHRLAVLLTIWIAATSRTVTRSATAESPDTFAAKCDSVGNRGVDRTARRSNNCCCTSCCAVDARSSAIESCLACKRV